MGIFKALIVQTKLLINKQRMNETDRQTEIKRQTDRPRETDRELIINQVGDEWTLNKITQSAPSNITIMKHLSFSLWFTANLPKCYAVTEYPTYKTHQFIFHTMPHPLLFPTYHHVHPIYCLLSIKSIRTHVTAVICISCREFLTTFSNTSRDRPVQHYFHSVSSQKK